MLSNTLNTNEIKNAAGVEVEFEFLEQVGRKKVYALKLEPPSLRYRLSINHAETGSGFTLRRRSVRRFDKTVISTVDLVTPVTISDYHVVDIPVGALLTSAEIANVIANGLSFDASLGATTTILYDCTGNGAACLLNGSL